MILVPHAHGPQVAPGAGGGGQRGGGGGGGGAQAAGASARSKTARPACRKSTATSRSTGTSAPARCSSRSRASTPTSCSPPASRPVSGRTTSASIAVRAARARVVSFQRVGPNVLLVQRNESFRSSSPNRGRAQVGRRLVREVGALGLHRRRREQRPRAGRRDPIFCCATCTAPAARCGPARIASTARAARSTCRARRPSRRTPKST